MLLSEFKEDFNLLIGKRVRTLHGWPNVPGLTEGVVDEIYHGDSVMVAWDLPDRPLPAGYCQYEGQWAAFSGILRDGFAKDELKWLELVSLNPVSI